MNIDFPLHFDRLGRTAAADDENHVRQMIEQLLFTRPGERVNRADFGSGIMQMVFAPNSSEFAAALQFTVEAAIQRYLADVIDIQSLKVSAVDSTLSVDLDYIVRSTGQPASAQFSRQV